MNLEFKSSLTYNRPPDTNKYAIQTNTSAPRRNPVPFFLRDQPPVH